MDTTQVVHELSSMVMFWKWFSIGLIGFPLHWLFAIRGDMSPVGKLKEFFTKYWADQLFALLSYWLLVYAWHDGIFFTVFGWMGWSIEPFKLNILTFVLAFFAASIMSSIITFTEFIGKKFSDRFIRVAGDKIDNMGAPKP